MEDESYLNKRGLTHFWDNIDTLKQDKLTAGANISINNNTISSSQPTATTNSLGVVQVGSGLSISSGGVLSANGGGTADDVAWGHITGTMTDQTDLTSALGAKANTADLAAVATSGSYNDLSNKPTIPTVNDATLTIQKNSTSVGTFTANASQNKTINIPVPTTAAEVSALPDSTKYGASFTASINTTTYVMTLTLKDQDGNTLGTAQTIDLPLESVVVSGSYDSTNKKIILTLQSGGTIDIPVGDLVSGLQTEITSSNKLASDLVDDTGQTNKFMTSAEKTKLSGIAAGAEVNVQSDWTQTTTTADDYIKNKPNLATVATSGSYNDLSNKPTIPTVNNATLTIQKNGTTVKTFTANASSNVTANITVPTKTSDITNDSNFVASSDLATVATSGSYNDLSNKPTIPAAQVNSDWNASSGVAQILNKPNLATVATSGSYNDLSNKPTIPTVNNGQLTIQKNGSNVATFTANQSGNSTANISVPTKTSDLTNDGADNTSTYIETDDAQKFAIGQGSTNPVFDDMTPVRTIEWDIATASYRPIYTIANTGWTYTNMDITIAYRITVTGTNISQKIDVVERWINPINYPITSAMMWTQSTSAGTTGIRYLRAVYPTSSYLNNTTYPLGMEIYPYNATSRHIKIEVFKDNSNVVWNTTLASASIYVSATYNGYNSIEAYTTRGWKFRQPVQMYANSAGAASYMTDFEAVNTAAGDLKSGATALTAGHYAFLADDGLVYDVSNTTANISMGESKFGFINSNIAANTAIGYTYWRAISRPNATQVDYIPHGTIALGDRVFLRCTMDANGNIHSDNYLSTTMSAGYTWMPFGWARSASTLYVDTRFPKFYTLDSNGELTHIDGQKVAGMTSVAWSDITGKPTFATVATSGSYNDLSNKPTIPTVNNGTLTITQNGTSKGTFTANQSSAATIALTDTTYSAMGGATSSAAGTSGLVPAPAAGDDSKYLKGDGTWATVQSGSSYTAGNHISISNNTINAVDYVHSENPVSLTSPTAVVTGSMITNGTITADKLAAGTTVQLTLSTADIGEGSALAANTLYGVYI